MSIDDTQYCAQCESYAKKLEQAQRRVEHLERALYVEWRASLYVHQTDRIELVLGKRRLAALRREA